MQKKEKWIIGILVVSFVLTVFISIAKNNSTSKTKSTKDGFLSSKNKIAVIYLYGTIHFDQNSGFLSMGTDEVICYLKDLSKEKNLKAVILRINSPGGTPGASQELYNELIKFKEQTKIPIIASIADVGASGAYWVSLSADRIFSNGTSIVGSIGVIMQNLDLSELSEKYGLGIKTIKSGKYKDIFSAWRNPTKQEKEMLEGFANNIHDQFINTFIDSRKLSKSRARELAQGQIFTGEQAIKVGLIDEIGGLEDALKYAKEKTKIKDTPTIISIPQNPMKNFFKSWQKKFQTFLPLDYYNIR